MSHEIPPMKVFRTVCLPGEKARRVAFPDVMTDIINATEYRFVRVGCGVSYYGEVTLFIDSKLKTSKVSSDQLTALAAVLREQGFTVVYNVEYSRVDCLHIVDSPLLRYYEHLVNNHADMLYQ